MVADLASVVEAAGGLRGLARQSKIPYTTLRYTFNESDHEALKAFLEFCRAVKCTPSDITAILGSPKRREALRSLIIAAQRERKDAETIKDFVRANALSEKYVFQLMNGTSGNKVLRLYIPLCAALNLTLDQFVDHIP